MVAPSTERCMCRSATSRGTTHLVRRSAALAFGVSVWTVTGAAVAGLLTLAVGSLTNDLTVTGLVVAVGAIGWAMGPAKAPMVWSEGALMSYQGNADVPPGVTRRGHWRVLAVPGVALAAGLLLVGIAGIVAAG